MDISEVIADLEAAKTTERMLDGYIASLFGWRRDVKYIVREGLPEPLKKVTWLAPNGRAGIVPHYTTSLNAAMELAETIVPMRTWACGYCDGRGRAVIGGGEKCEAVTPAMALCVAALKAKHLLDG